MVKNWGRVFKHPKKATATAGLAAAILYGGFELNQRSEITLAPTSPRIQSVARCAATKPMKLTTGEKISFVVYHGLRTEAEQREMLAKAVSWVNRSRHQDGVAIDVMARIHEIDPISKKEIIIGTWDHAPYYEIAQAFYTCGMQMSIPITWGGEWKVRDMVHFEEKR